MSIKERIAILSEGENVKKWSQLKDHLSLNDYKTVEEQARALHPGRYEEIAQDLVKIAFNAVCERDREVAEYLDSLPPDWYRNPFYCAYVPYFGVKKGESQGTFRSLAKMLPYLHDLGIRNLYLLPHYESPLWDHGYDVSDYVPAKSLGGDTEYRAFMRSARSGGFRVVTDAVFNHTSIEHPWFKQALAGDKKYLDYYLKVDSWKKIGELNVEGDLRVQYVDDENNFMERTLIFPDITRQHYIEVEIKGRKRKFYSGFYPFQVDLDLQNPQVLREIWRILGKELNSGILGKRTDAIAHWLKPKGAVDADGNPETFALHTLVKIFMKLVSPKSIIIPEAVRSVEEIARYLGESTAIHGVRTTTQGDAAFNFHAQGSLREALCFCTSSAWWEYWANHHSKAAIPPESAWLNLLGHHDEIYMGFIRERNRHYFRNYIQNHQDGPGGVVYKEGMSAGARTANCLLHDERRIAMAFFLLYMIPGVPTIYYGDEIAAASDYDHAIQCQNRQASVFRKLGIPISPEKAFDPRELHRGTIERKRFVNGKNGLIARVVRRLNELWRDPVVRSPLLHDIPCGDDGIVAMEKYMADHEEGLKNPPLIALANLTNQMRIAKLPLQHFHDSLQTGKGNPLRFKALIQTSLKKEHRDFELEGDDRVAVPTIPYEFMLLGKG